MGASTGCGVSIVGISHGKHSRWLVLPRAYGLSPGVHYGHKTALAVMRIGLLMWVLDPVSNGSQGVRSRAARISASSRCFSNQGALSGKRYAAYYCPSTFPAPRLTCRARKISESVTLTVLCSNCASSPAPQRACRSGRDSQSFSCGGGIPHTRDDSSSQ